MSGSSHLLPLLQTGSSLLWLLPLLCRVGSVPVGPDIDARARLIKDLPSGMFAGVKIPNKVGQGMTKHIQFRYRLGFFEFDSRERKCPS